MTNPNHQACGYKNAHGVECGLGKHPDTVPHELSIQLVPPAPFAIKVSDAAALAAIRCWIIAAKAMGANEEKIAGAEKIYHEFRRWQNAHGAKVPD